MLATVGELETGVTLGSVPYSSELRGRPRRNRPEVLGIAARNALVVKRLRRDPAGPRTLRDASIPRLTVIDRLNSVYPFPYVKQLSFD